MPFKFENLVAWRKAVDHSDEVNVLVKKFPKDELHVLISQIKRAADSISLNIAEGSTGQTHSEFSRFLGYSLRSNFEAVACIYLARRRVYVSKEEFERLYAMCEEILLMINALRRSLRKEI